MLLGGRAPNDALLTTSSLAVGQRTEPVAVAAAAAPPELLAASGRRVEVERGLVLVARSHRRTQLTQLYRPATNGHYDAASTLHNDDFCAAARLPMLCSGCLELTTDKKLSYRRGTARCVVSVEILPIATQQCRNYLYDKS